MFDDEYMAVGITRDNLPAIGEKLVSPLGNKDYLVTMVHNIIYLYEDKYIVQLKKLWYIVRP